MNKIKKYLLPIFFFILVAIQFLGPERPSVIEDNPDDLLLTEEVPDSISSLLVKACYDCHSMETKFPLYASIAPVSWFIYGHINHARKELNFSEWQTLDKRTKLKLLKKFEDEMENRNMPLSSYTWLHGDAKLSDDEVNHLIAWSDELSKKVFSAK